MNDWNFDSQSKNASWSKGLGLVECYYFLNVTDHCN